MAAPLRQTGLRASGPSSGALLPLPPSPGPVCARWPTSSRSPTAEHPYVLAGMPGGCRPFIRIAARVYGG
jgi:hypothetical protein